VDEVSEFNFRDYKSYRAARLAPYHEPLSAASQRGLALEEAITATERAIAAVMGASVHEPDKSRTRALRQIYAELRCALASMKELDA
jgi:hypothetical protein